MAKNLNIEVPKDAEIEAVNKKPMRTGVFTRTRIAALSLILVMALAAVGVTQAYLQWTNNQTPNRESMGSVEVEIVETNTVDGTQQDDVDTGDGKTTTATTDGGNGNKQVKLKSDADPNRAEEVVRVHFVPEIESKSISGAHVAIKEYWGKGVQKENGKSYLETSVMKLWLADDWETYWIYKNGSFYYKKVLLKDTKTPVLLTGVTLQDSVNKNDYASIKVNVVANALQATPKEALAEWGLEITGEKTDTADNRVVGFKAEDADEEESTG